MVRVLIAVFDGLQPAQVTPQTTPELYALSQRGVTFSRHHGVFPTVTRVNTASIVTGVTPGTHGLMGNSLYAPEVDATRHIDALMPEMSKLNDATGGNLLRAPALGELLAPHGMSFVSVVGGSSGCAFVQFPRPDRSKGALIHAEFCVPQGLHQEVQARFGPWPFKSSPAVQTCEHVADIFVNLVMPELRPDVALVWFPEPDTSQHAWGVSSSQALQGLAAADAQLGRVLRALTAAGDDPVVLAISDHGYSTIHSTVNVERELSQAGFMTGPMGGLIFAPNGGAGLFYNISRDEALTARLADWLAGREWVGGIIAGGQGDDPDGLLSGKAAGISGRRSPDLAVTFRWDTQSGRNGHRGSVFATNGSAGHGTHGSASPQELRATLIASGPGIKHGVTSDVPTGQQDIVPTTLSLLGLTRPAHVEGRNISEMYVAGPSPLEVMWQMETGRSILRGGSAKFRQRIDVAVCGTARYVAAIGRAEDFPL